MIKNPKGKLIFEFNDVIDIIDTLSHSQGFYGRLLRDIYELKKYEPELKLVIRKKLKSLLRKLSEKALIAVHFM